MWSEAFGYADLEAKPAGHLGGIRHYRGDEFLLNRRFESVTEVLAIFRDDSLLHAPLFTPQRTANGEGTSYDIGWAISRDTLGHDVVGHTGGSVGGTTVLRLDRDSKLVVAVVSNLSDARLGEAAP